MILVVRIKNEKKVVVESIRSVSTPKLPSKQRGEANVPSHVIKGYRSHLTETKMAYKTICVAIQREVFLSSLGP